MQHLLKKGVQATKTEWETLKRVYGWVHQIAEVLGDAEALKVEERQLRFVLILMHMQEQVGQLEPSWQKAIAHFLTRHAELWSTALFLLSDP